MMAIRGVRICPVCGGYITCRTDLTWRRVHGVTALVHRGCQDVEPAR